MNNLIKLLNAIKQNLPLTNDKLFALQKKYTKENGEFFSKSDLIIGYKKYTHPLQGKALGMVNPKVIKALQRKPTRTISGVAPVTVFTKPYPCSGNCIFCPNDPKMPKSYLSSEPGCMRALRNKFDPYLQTYNRVLAFNIMGHPIDKIELIILGGTWTDYPQSYQIWFVKQCFKALNKFKLENIKPQKTNLKRDISEKSNFKTLFKEHKINETAQCRCVGLTIETRPDLITKQEIIKLRKLGCTKVQIGVQYLDNKILKKNNRGHKIKHIKKAFDLLRLAGFKIHAHWMANLYGTNLKKDKKNYLKLFKNKNFRPDELKIYPCALLKNTKLEELYFQKKWQPYTQKQLLNLLGFCLTHTPRYCRLTRVVRDIPAQDILAGNKESNLREQIEAKLQKENAKLLDIRAREIKQTRFNYKKIKFKKTIYQTKISKEIFLEYLILTKKGEKLLGFLRLSLPKQNLLKELKNSAIIREVHIYGPATKIKKTNKNTPQHLGLGKKLIQKAKQITSQNNYQYLAVISAIGTRRYYYKLGFNRDNLYLKLPAVAGGFSPRTI